ncbi:zinc finger protein 660-like [Phlebotomus papatasi]|uniref:zinc finger protein 660-like n=1 Tax=Phlebotomus papatasi TaxID=29031 RepID=UPI0024846EAF|nr:zinc finger protein 660-like [Phlebotomus papatasi]
MGCFELADTCRACQIRTQEESKKIFIFNTVKLPDIFKETTSLDIHENDGLPKVLCCSCYDRLLEAYNFRKMCSAAVLYFKKILSMDVPEEKYTPPENLITQPAEIKAEPVDASDSPPRKLSYRPDRDDAVSDISDMLSIDENLPEILKTDPDDGTAEEDTSYFPPGRDCTVDVSNTLPKEKLQDDSDDDTPLIIRKTRKLKKPHKKLEKSTKSQKETKEITLQEDLPKYECSICSSVFRQKSYLEMHIWKDHLGLKACVCKICGKEYKSSNGLRKHSNSHRVKKSTEVQKGTKQYVCAVCGIDKVTATELRTHESIHNKDGMWFCVTCPYKAVRKYSLTQHVKVYHHGIKEFHCAQCNKSYTEASGLKHHMLRHKGIKRFKCNTCDFMTVTLTKLKIHTNTHTREKLWQCEYCSYISLQNFRLKQHMRLVHNKKMNFKCPRCSGSYVSAQALKLHMKRHERIERYQCTICGTKTITGVELKAHMRTHKKVPERPKVCNQCDKVFKKPSELQRHLKCHLNPNYKPKIKKKSEIEVEKNEKSTQEPTLTGT